jgi:hypothetical protein
METVTTSQLKKVVALLRDGMSLEVPLSQLEVFLIVAENDGINQEEIAKQVSYPGPTVTRNIMKLANVAEGSYLLKTGKPGYGVCRVSDDGSVSLTEKGKQLLKDISGVV